MRKTMLLLAIVILLLTACTAESRIFDNQTGTIVFNADVSRGITASIEYPSLLDKTWTLTAAKTDGGAATGAGTFENVVLTDTFGPFSIGSWSFTLTDSDGQITGTAAVNIKAGVNTVNLTVHSTATRGTLSIENCNLLLSTYGEVTYVDLYIDGERMNTDWVIANIESDDGDFYVLPTYTEKLTSGVHTVRLYYGTPSGGYSSDTVSIRVVNGMTTHFSIGEQDGNLTLSVSFDVQSALVE